METKFTIEDIEGDTVSFRVSDSVDLMEISIPFNEMTMCDGTASVVLEMQDFARLVTKLGPPEATEE